MTIPSKKKISVLVAYDISDQTLRDKLHGNLRQIVDSHETICNATRQSNNPAYFSLNDILQEYDDASHIERSVFLYYELSIYLRKFLEEFVNEIKCDQTFTSDSNSRIQLCEVSGESELIVFQKEITNNISFHKLSHTNLG